MALEHTTDLAILEFSQLQRPAERNDIPNSCDLARADVVATLHANGIGTCPPGPVPSQFLACGEKCLPSMVPCLKKTSRLHHHSNTGTCYRSSNQGCRANKLAKRFTIHTGKGEPVGERCWLWLVSPALQNSEKTIDPGGSAQVLIYVIPPKRQSINSKMRMNKELKQKTLVLHIICPRSSKWVHGRHYECSSASIANTDGVSFQPVMSTNLFNKSAPSSQEDDTDPTSTY